MNKIEMNEIELDKLTRQIVKTTPLPEMDPQLANMVLSKIASPTERALPEKMVTAIFISTVVLTVVFALLGSVNTVLDVLAPLKNAPWLLILTVSIMLCLIKLQEVLAIHRVERLGFFHHQRK